LVADSTNTDQHVDPAESDVIVPATKYDLSVQS